MSNGFRCRAATRKCHSSHETAARIDATKHAIHQPDAHQVALDRARKGVTRAKHFRKSPALLSALFSTVRCIKSGLRATSQLIWVKLRRTQCEQMSSGLLLKADIARRSWHVSNVPKNEPALAGGRWPVGRAYCVYRSNHLIERG